jgi:hypothetical protein
LENFKILEILVGLTQALKEKYRNKINTLPLDDEDFLNEFIDNLGAELLKSECSEAQREERKERLRNPDENFGAQDEISSKEMKNKLHKMEYAEQKQFEKEGKEGEDYSEETQEYPILLNLLKKIKIADWLSISDHLVQKNTKFFKIQFFNSPT